MSCINRIIAGVATTALLALGVNAFGDAVAATPPSNSKYFLEVKADGSLSESGLSLIKNGKEDRIGKSMVEDIPCSKIITSLYLTASWENMLAWQGAGNDIVLQIRYFDEWKGTLGIRYDSCDQKALSDLGHPGAWRTPNAGPIQLVGDGKWKTAERRLEKAYFRKQLSGADISLEPSKKNLPIAWVALSLAPLEKKEEAVSQAFSIAGGSVPGQLSTVPVKPFDVVRWGKLSFQASETPSKLEFSFDGGINWQAIPANNDLSGIPCKGGGADSISFKATFDSKTVTPAFKDGAIEYLPGKRNFKTLEDKFIRIDFDAFSVLRIFDKARGKEVSSAEAPAESMALVTVKEPGFAPAKRHFLANAAFDGVEMSGTTEKPILTLRHTLSNGIKLATTIKLLGNGESEWNLAIDNPTKLEICGIRFPMISGVQLGGDFTDDTHFLGRDWRQTVTDYKIQGMKFPECGTAMRWNAIYDKAQGIYLGIEDERTDDWNFAYGSNQNGCGYLGATQLILAKPESKWLSATYRIALFDGDWHKAADLYKEHVSGKLKQCDVPHCVKWSDGWTYDTYGEARHSRGWDAIASEKFFSDGKSPMMADNMQMLDGADGYTCGVFPYPSPVWGSLNELKQKIALRKALGGFWYPYLNFHLWAPGYGHGARVGTFPKSRLPSDIPSFDDAWYSKVAIRNFAGSYSRTELDPFRQVDVSVCSREWRDWLAYWTKQYIGYGADGMYYDQFNMVLTHNGVLQPEYPDTYGCWASATCDTIKNIKEESRKADPFWTSVGELCNDVYGQYLDMHMTSGVFSNIEQFLYCNPQQIVLSGCWNGGLFGGAERWRYVWQTGARFEGDINLSKEIVALRRAVKSLLYNADFRDTVGVDIRNAEGNPLGLEEKYWWGGRGVGARWFLYKRDGFSGAIVNIINAASVNDGETTPPDSKKPASIGKTAPVKGATLNISTKEFGPVKAAAVFTLDGRVFPLDGVEKDGIYSFKVPESELSSIILSNKLPPVVDWNYAPAATTSGTPCEMTIKVTNVNAEALSGKAALRLPNDWKTPPAADFGAIATGTSATLTLDFNVPEDNSIRGRFDIWADLSSNYGGFSAYSFLSVNEPVIGDFRGNPGSYSIWLRNLSNKEFSGSVRVSAPEPLKASCKQDFTIAPQATIELPVELANREALTEISEMKATVSVEGRKLELFRGVLPLLPNPGFEQDTAGDMKPDWWMCRNKKMEFTYQQLSLSTDAHTGKYALKLAPVKTKGDDSWAYPVNSYLTIQAKYKVSIWIKSEAENGVWADIFSIKKLGEGKTGKNEWRKFEVELVYKGGHWPPAVIALHNASDKDALFDEVSIEEMK